MALITFTDRGPYCEQADVYVDPWKPVRRAIITHGHSDHARRGHSKYLSTPVTKPIMQHRLGSDISVQTLDYGEALDINGVEISFHPAGHIPGSAQVRLAYKGEIWVITGDYKVEDDGFSEAFEPVKCQHFITESTFALPIYRWKPQEQIAAEINEWWRTNQANGKVSMIGAYALGKAQRIIHLLDHTIGPIYTHGAVDEMNRVLSQAGMHIKHTERVDKQEAKEFVGSMVVAPPGAFGGQWMKRFKSALTASASGWMQVRGIKRRRGVDKGFVLSDHADWPGLIQAIEATDATNIYATHGYTEVFSQYLRDHGYNAVSLDTGYGDQEDEISATT